MKHVDLFASFLNETVNLNQTRIDTLQQRVEAVSSFLRESEYKPNIMSFAPQGSWAHRTIIKPVNANGEFDADLVLYVDEVEGWSPKDYIVELRSVLWDNKTYVDKTSYKTRCVKIDYANDFHLDLVPIVVRDAGASGVQVCCVCNRAEDKFEQTDGNGFANWWLGRNQIVAGNDLLKATRIIKYIRDKKGTFSAKSVLLTTLIGNQVWDADRFSNSLFVDVPTTLKTIVGRLDEWLQAHFELPPVYNPVLAGESFTRNWTQDQYENFREKVSLYRSWIDDAFDEPDNDASIQKWRLVLGEKFASGVAASRGVSVVVAIAEEIARGQDLVAAVLQHGKLLLQRMPRVLPHVQAVPYREAGSLSIIVYACEEQHEGAPRGRRLESGDAIRSSSGMRFFARLGTGMPISKEYEISWQVVNTDRAAAEAGQLRGEFNPSKPHAERWEATKYRGVHWVQAFMIKNGRLYGQSERFFVVVV